MNGSKPFDAYVGGRRYGSWWEIDGREVVVSGAYGSGRAPLGRKKPEKVAEEILTRIVQERRH